MAEILPFPLTRRRVMIHRQANYAAQLRPDAAERHLARQLRLQEDSMRRRGIDEELIVHELQCMETAIRALLERSTLGGAR